MDDDDAPHIDPRKVRIGLVLIGFVVVVGVALLFVIDDPLGRLIMGAIVVFVVIRTALLARSLRRGRATSD